MTHRNVTLKGFLVEGNKLLRNVEITVENPKSYLEEALQELRKMQASEVSYLRNFELKIVIDVVGNTLGEKDRWMKRNVKKTRLR